MRIAVAVALLLTSAFLVPRALPDHPPGQLAVQLAVNAVATWLLWPYIGPYLVQIVDELW